MVFGKRKMKIYFKGNEYEKFLIKIVSKNELTFFQLDFNKCFINKFGGTIIDIYGMIDKAVPGIEFNISFLWLSIFFRTNKEDPLKILLDKYLN